MEKLSYDGNQITSWDKCDWRPKETKKAKQRALKLSEAMRIGAKFRSQCTDGRYFQHGGSCALGAAYEAIFGHTDEMMVGMVLRKHFADESLPIIFQEVIRRNDAGESREKIADWLEQQGY